MPIPFEKTEYIMECTPAPNNIHDPLAVLVKEIGNDRIIGRVPKNICNVISIESRVTKNLIRCISLYTPVSTPGV